MKRLKRLSAKKSWSLVKSLLEALGYHGMTITEVSGRGRRKRFPEMGRLKNSASIFCRN